MKRYSPLPSRPWKRGESDLGLLGFAYREERDAYNDGADGPFERIIMPSDWVASEEVRIIKAYLGGDLANYKPLAEYDA